MKTAWLEKALKKLSMDELQTTLEKVEQLYHSGCKIISVQRDESHRPKVTVQITNGQMKLISL